MSLTKVLHILIGDELHNNSQRAALDTPGEVALVHNDSIGHGSGNKGQTIGELCRRRVVVKEDTRQAVAEDGEQQCHMSIDCQSAFDSHSSSSD